MPLPGQGSGSPAGGGSDWARVRRLVEAAMDLAPDERTRFLSEECGGDDALRRAVDALLERDAPDTPGLSPPAAAELRSVLASDPARAEQRRVGPYELRRELGVGGMGTVWLAVRSDGQFHRQVAVKLIRRGMDSEEILERFRRERQVLANLDHPGIARLIDGGATEDGMPFLVMEYVAGVSIDEYCDEHRLSTRDRVELFRKVCDAVQYAHRNLVVHRDLKPSNILVTPEGEPKLLDFGIAKVLDPEKVSAGVDLTGAVMQFMTPTYASPEQVRGRPITTSSDCYSLGVILYRLLTGHLPLELETTSAAEIERIVCEEEPVRPSTVITKVVELPEREVRGTTKRLTPEIVSRRRLTTPRALRRALAGDLDQVVLKALRKEPSRRYVSVDQLAEDLRRFLAGEPVSARPDSAGYRFSKLVRRNKVAFAAAAAVLLSLSAGLVVSSEQYRRASSAREAERGLREVAEARAGELARLADQLREEKARAEEQESLAKASLAEVERLSVDLRHQKELVEARFDDVVEFATQMIYQVHSALVPVEGALRARELVLELGISHLDRLAAEHGIDPELARNLALAYLRMGSLKGGGDVANLGRREEALELYDRALELAEGLVAEHPEDVRNDRVLAEALMTIGDLLHATGRTSEARDYYERALEPALRIEESGSMAPGHRYVLAIVLLRMGDSYDERGELDLAADYYSHGGAILDELVQSMPRLRSDQAMSHGRAARVFERAGRLEDALREDRQAVEIVDAAMRSAPVDPSLVRSRWGFLQHMTSVLLELGRADEALQIVDETVVELEEFHRRSPEDAGNGRDLLSALSSRTTLLHRSGDLEEAIECARRAVDLADGLEEAGVDGPLARVDLARTLHQRGRVEMSREEYSRAVEDFERARHLLEEAVEKDPEYVPVRQTLLLCHAASGRSYERMARRPGETEGFRREYLEKAAHHMRLELEAASWLVAAGGFRADWEEGLAQTRELLAACERELGAER